MGVLPGQLALTQIADGSLAVAAEVRNDFAAIQSGFNALLGILDDGVAGQVLTGVGTTLTWAIPAGLTYRKTTAKTVNTTVAATDLLNAEITIAAGALGTTGCARLTAWGDWIHTTGGPVAAPRFQLVLGGTTLLDTGTTGTVGTHANRAGWKIVCEILNSGAANAQTASLNLQSGLPGQASAMATFFTTGNGLYEGTTFRASAQGTNATAVDTATSKTLVLNVINGSASASYETKLLGATVEIY
jgi:hypothetical protein